MILSVNCSINQSNIKSAFSLELQFLVKKEFSRKIQVSRMKQAKQYFHTLKRERQSKAMTNHPTQ